MEEIARNATPRDGKTRKLSRHAARALLTLDTALGVGAPKLGLQAKVAKQNDIRYSKICRDTSFR